MMIRKCIDSENFESTGFSYEPLALYLEVAFVYLLMNSALTVLQSKLEKRLSKHVQQRTN